jgi:hypothetical protein
MDRDDCISDLEEHMSTTIDWSKYGRGKKPEQPNAEITFYGKEGEVRIRADFPIHGLDEVVKRIKRQLDYWRSQPE